MNLERACLLGAGALGLLAPLQARAQAAACDAEIVFVIDTSTSVVDEATAICNAIANVDSQLQAAGLGSTSTVWSITSGGNAASFPCVTDSVEAQLGGTVPGNDGTCDGFLDQEESWGQAVAIVADGYAWSPDVVRIIVPISDGGACNGDPCLDPGEDRDTITNAISLANANDVVVSPVAADGASFCVHGLQISMAVATGGIFQQTTSQTFDLGGTLASTAIFECTARLGCVVTPQLATDPTGGSHTATVTVTEYDGVAFSPDAGRQVTVTVDSGPNVGETVTSTTNANGEVTLTYVGDGGPGVDVIDAICEDFEGTLLPTLSPAQMFWDDDCNANEVPDTCDLDCAGFSTDCLAYDADCGLSIDADGDGQPDECAVVNPPPPPPAGGPCILGVDKVRLADRATTGDDIASYGTTELGADAVSGSIESDGRVFLRSRAIVNGDVVTSGIVREQQHAQVLGTITEYGTPILPAIPVVGGPGYGSGNLVVGSGQTRTLTPGTYGNVTVNSNATLVLDGAGEYGFRRLTVNSGATLDYTAGAELFVHDRFIWRGTQAGAGPLDFGQTGTGWTHFEADWDGAIVAPDANVRLAGNGGPSYVGSAFVGRSILVETDTTVTCD